MKPVRSLAQHLANFAIQTPDAPALIAGGKTWSSRRLLAEASHRAEQIASTSAPYMLQGSALELAFHAYACSVKNRVFWPVHRNIPDQGALPAPDTALIISTSGSEGQPKAVMLSHGNLDAAAIAANQRLPLGPGDCWLACLPLYHIGGQSILWRCAEAGATVLLHDGFDAALVARDFVGRTVTHISLVPAMLALLLDAGIRPPASLRHAMIGGAALSKVLFERASRAGWPLNPSYGMSESAAQIATWTPADGPWQEGLVGRALGDNELAISEDGRIRLRGPQRMTGYLAAGGLDQGAWLTTGDLGKIDHFGRLTVTGRADDMLISAGCNVHPLQVESCLAACPGIRDIAVTGLPDKVWGELVVALVVGSASTDEVINWSKARLPSAAQPRRIVHLTKLPRTPGGKLERSALRQLAAGVKP